jgi:hypothetical protein
MKQLILLTIFAICCGNSLSQENQINNDAIWKWRIGLSTNIAIGQPLHFAKVMDDGSYDGKESFSLGIQFCKNFSLKNSIKFGFLYSSYKVRYESGPFVPIPIGVTENFNSIFIPVLYNRSFNHLFHFGIGTIIEFALPRNSEYSDSQSGFGLITEFGKEFLIKRFVLDISPNLEIHSLIPFINSIDDQQRIFVFGVRFGFYYNLKYK